ncbi:class II glutamine amidotransferase [Paraliomyxa miuraensis]|uniref:class II glutamine amidotransferase n=1 Tax=Paraliomyxa miuraensis TaxID=376150 RepID=UPI0022530A8C|nr:class II glutamine amidotransferase [Paraliomyxa miuraensis]MCX4243494.1 class II glutamine amidotransferase [Paraliomyxa miuraensis]
MCRVLSYLGPPILIDDLLYKPDSSLIRQSYEPQLLEMLNLAGFGMIAWDRTSFDPERPWQYRSTEVPIYDANLKSLAEKMRTTCLLAHVRGIPYRADFGFGPHNLHPFAHPGARWAMAHNGDVPRHNEMRHDLFSLVTPRVRQQIRGTTDSETIYALVLSALERRGRDDPDDLVAAIMETLEILARVRLEHGVDVNSSINLCFCDGRSLVGLRFTFDYGKYELDSHGRGPFLSLWYSMGEAYQLVDGAWQMTGDPDASTAVAIASEPLSRDITGWFEVPEYTILLVDRDRIETVEVPWLD